MMWSLILWAIAPIFNAIMDLVENENFSSSIFFQSRPFYTLPFSSKGRYSYKWNNWWYKRESWKSAKKIFGYKLDAWHLAKSIMIILAVISAVIGIYIEGPLFHLFNDDKWLNFIVEIIVRGLWWNATFLLFYNILFRRKTWEK